MNERELLSGLDPEQLAAVRAPRGPVCVLAGAGTGKTRTIVYRIAHLIHSGHIAAGQVLAVTYTARAAGELRTRLRALDIHSAQARTFHAAALRQLRYFWPRVVGGEQWELVDAKLRIVGQAAHRVGVDTEVEMLRDLATEIEWAKASLVAPDDYPAAVEGSRRQPPASADEVAQVYRAYESIKTKAKLLDFDDLLLHTTAALEEHPQIAEEFRDRYRCFVVDEFQDVTPLQQRVLSAWLGRRDDLTVVGDPNQTIYSFAGASPRPLLDFPRRFPDATVVRLERDYRSTPEVVAAANQVIAFAKDRPAGSRLRLIGQRSPGPQPRFAEHEDEPAEAVAVAARIKELHAEGTPLSEIAVLYRINAQSEVYEQELSKVDIPYLVRGGERFFARQEVRRAMVALRKAAAEQPTGELPPVRASGERGQAGGLPEEPGYPGANGRRNGKSLGPSPHPELCTVVRELLGPHGLTPDPPVGGTTRERWESLLALVELAEELVSTVPDADLPRYVAELEIRAEAQHPPTVEGVTLASLHSAKGLEWDAVFLVGLADGTLPIQYADGDDAAIEEERRLLYVGVTRARQHLSLSWALARAEGAKRRRRRSRFLYGLIPDGHPVSRQPQQQHRDGGRVARNLCRVCGSALIGAMATKLGRCESCPANLDEELLGRLREWRAERARGLKVPSYVVFTDATLTAIAERRPTDSAGLVAISGIGAAKLDKFGAEVLALVARQTTKSDEQAKL